MNQTTFNTPPIWVDTPSMLTDLVVELTSQPYVAVDTESNSLYRYYEQICLVQISTPNQDYLIDPLAVGLAPLGEFFASPTCQKVFHAAEYDIICLKRDYNFVVNNLFDTMLAARVLGWSRYGLGNLLNEHFQVTINKKFQKYDWGQRPLADEALNYARLDTHYLLRLRQTQLDNLHKTERLAEANDFFQRILQVEPQPPKPIINGFWRLKGLKTLNNDAEKGILYELFLLRERLAEQMDRPPFKVMSEHALVSIAQRQPRTQQALSRIRGLNKTVFSQHCDDLLQAVQTGRGKTPPKRPRSPRLSDEASDRYQTLRQWRNELAQSRQIEADVIIDNHTLMEIAKRGPAHLTTLAKTGLLSDWQLESYGERLLGVLQPE